jgi:hypothetical protein
MHLMSVNNTFGIYSTGSPRLYYSKDWIATRDVLLSYGSRNFIPGDTVGIAYNADIGSVEFYLNGVAQGVAVGPSDVNPAKILSIKGQSCNIMVHDGSSSDSNEASYTIREAPKFAIPDFYSWWVDQLSLPMLRREDADGRHLWSGPDTRAPNDENPARAGLGGAFYSFRATLTGPHRLWIKTKCHQPQHAKGAWYFVSNKGDLSFNSDSSFDGTATSATWFDTGQTYDLVEGATQSISVLPRRGECRAYEIYLGPESPGTNADAVAAAPLFSITPGDALRRLGCAPNPWNVRRCNFNLEFGGKAIRLVGSRQGKPENYVIDCGATFVNEDVSAVPWLDRRGAVFTHGETEATVMEGLTFANCRVTAHGRVNVGTGSHMLFNMVYTSALHNRGGGILAYGASPTLKHVTVDTATAMFGGAFCFEGSNAVLENIAVMDGSAWSGGGLFLVASRLTMIDVAVNVSAVAYGRENALCVSFHNDKGSTWVGGSLFGCHFRHHYYDKRPSAIHVSFPEKVTPGTPTLQISDIDVHTLGPQPAVAVEHIAQTSIPTATKHGVVLAGVRFKGEGFPDIYVSRNSGKSLLGSVPEPPWLVLRDIQYNKFNPNQYSSAVTVPPENCDDVWRALLVQRASSAQADAPAPASVNSEVGCDALMGAPGQPCIETFRATDHDTCKQFGMSMVVPRSRAHWASLVQRFGSAYFDTIPGVYKPSDGGDYGSVAMNSDAMPKGGYRALDGGGWWLRDTPNCLPPSGQTVGCGSWAQPSGDYLANCWLQRRDSSAGGGPLTDVNAIRFNDEFCKYSTTKYVCSDNRAEPVLAAIEHDGRDWSKPISVQCDVSSAGRNIDGAPWVALLREKNNNLIPGRAFADKRTLADYVDGFNYPHEK